jgi:hypothetical protein
VITLAILQEYEHRKYSQPYLFCQTKAVEPEFKKLKIKTGRRPEKQLNHSSEIAGKLIGRGQKKHI